MDERSEQPKPGPGGWAVGKKGIFFVFYHRSQPQATDRPLAIKNEGFFWSLESSNGGQVKNTECQQRSAKRRPASGIWIRGAPCPLAAAPPPGQELASEPGLAGVGAQFVGGLEFRDAFEQFLGWRRCDAATTKTVS
jgi:hypothetical protein